MSCGTDVRQLKNERPVSAKFDTLKTDFRLALETAGGEPVEAFLGEFPWDMPRRELAPRSLPCLEFLVDAAHIAPPWAQPLVSLLATDGAAFHWGQTYTAADFGVRFMERYGWLEVFGTRGHFVNETAAGGVLLLGPNVLYPDHHHVAEEIYVPLTGNSEWRMGDSDFVPRGAGEVIRHASNVSHAMRTGSDPLLALYLWRGGPLAARSVVTGNAGATR
ncbi:MAG: transcriptional regulator [Rhizobiaceae bacterium]|nr:transcriptional regulator [Rhizobiaceae bacterium]